eukprot:GDKH01014507.1.p1 GENE.GDKH01014507.1~~GDKH01014507.1.p1  ORF type:complete len:63 (+),score=1.20 GDKH01014507.1:23-211(+)
MFLSKRMFLAKIIVSQLPGALLGDLIILVRASSLSFVLSIRSFKTPCQPDDDLPKNQWSNAH